MIDRQLYRQLSIVDWDLIEPNVLDLSAIHWYPGSFAPGLPGVLVELLSAPNETVFDPFCGVGTTAVASILRGRNSISCDVSLIGIISGLATTGLISLLLSNQRLFQGVFSDLKSIVQESDSQNSLLAHPLRSERAVDDHINRYGGSSLSDVFPRLFRQPSLDNLRRWYHPKTLGELLRLIEKLEAAGTSQFCKLVGFTMVSAIARGTSSETRSWGHIADNVQPREFVYKEVPRAAIAWLQRTQKRLAEVRRAAAITNAPPTFEFRLVDWIADRPSFSPPPSTLLLTSPPYGGAIDYGLAQRLSLYLLGLSDDALAGIVSAEIGARRKRLKPGHVALWADELVKAVGTQVRSLSAGGFAAFVMPHKDHGRDAGELLLKEVLARNGWDLWFSADRSVRQSRTRQSWTSIKKETVLVFRGRE